MNPLESQTIDLDKAKIIFKRGGMMLKVDHEDRMLNKQLTSDLERALNPFIGEPDTELTRAKIREVASPIVENFKQSIVAGVKL